MSDRICCLLGNASCPLLFSRVGLRITYSVDLDRVKVVRGTNFFRRIFFLEEDSGNKVHTIKGVQNLTKQGESQCTPPRTVYLKVGNV